MDAIFETVLALIPLAVRPLVVLVLMALGALLVAVMAVIKLTPSKADDAALEKIRSVPVVGALLAWLVGKAPVQEK